MTIWALYHDDFIVIWWHEKPDAKTLSDILDVYENSMTVARLLNGEHAGSYSLVELSPGVRLDQEPI